MPQLGIETFHPLHGICKAIGKDKAHAQQHQRRGERAQIADTAVPAHVDTKVMQRHRDRQDDAQRQHLVVTPAAAQRIGHEGERHCIEKGNGRHQVDVAVRPHPLRPQQRTHHHQHGDAQQYPLQARPTPLAETQQKYRMRSGACHIAGADEGLPAIGGSERPRTGGEEIAVIQPPEYRAQGVPAIHRFFAPQQPEQADDRRQYQADSAVQNLQVMADEHLLAIARLQRLRIAYVHHAERRLVSRQPGHPNQQLIVSLP